MRRRRAFPGAPNRASSFHLWWRPPLECTGVEVTLEVIEPPSVQRLYFWAVQVGFLDDQQRLGAAHLGLQWHPAYPEATAVNFGGYGADGVELQGGDSDLPSALDNRNTRDFIWTASAPYRLRIEEGSGEGWWMGSVTNLESGATTRVRQVNGGGDRMGSVVVWSEVFARCDDPRVTVRWSDPKAWQREGNVVAPSHYLVTYQTEARGGCSNTNVGVGAKGVEQVTSQQRSVPDRALVPISLQESPH